MPGDDLDEFLLALRLFGRLPGDNAADRPEINEQSLRRLLHELRLEWNRRQRAGADRVGPLALRRRAAAARHQPWRSRDTLLGMEHAARDARGAARHRRDE